MDAEEEPCPAIPQPKKQICIGAFRVRGIRNTKKMKSLIERSQTSLTTSSIYKKKLKSLLRNNKSLAQALEKSNVLVSKLEKERSDLAWQLKSQPVVEQKLAQLSEKLRDMATLLTDASMIVVDTLTCLKPGSENTSNLTESIISRNPNTPTSSTTVSSVHSSTQQNFINELFQAPSQNRPADMSVITEMSAYTENLNVPLLFENETPVDKTVTTKMSLHSRQTRSSLNTSDSRVSVRLSSRRQSITPNAEKSVLIHTPETPAILSIGPRLKSNIPKVSDKKIEAKKSNPQTESGPLKPEIKKPTSFSVHPISARKPVPGYTHPSPVRKSVPFKAHPSPARKSIPFNTQPSPARKSIPFGDCLVG